MKVPDYILNLINREVNPHLESGKRYDDIGFSTREPHVLVDAIFSIVKDEETFNEFMHSKKNKSALPKKERETSPMARDAEDGWKNRFT